MAQAAVQSAGPAETIEAMWPGRWTRRRWARSTGGLALVSSGLFFDVMDFTIFGAFVPDILKSGFVSQAQIPWVGSATALGMVIGTLGQGEFTAG